MKYNKRDFLSGLALSGVVINGISWFKAGFKCKDIINEAKEEFDLVEDGDNAATRAVIFDATKKIIPQVIFPTVSSILTGFAIVGANNESAKELAVLSTAYTLARTNLDDTKNKVKELFGDKNERDVYDKIRFDYLKRDKEFNNVITEPGDCICKDVYSGRYFSSNPAKIQHAIDKVSFKLVTEVWVPLNDFYELLDLDPVKMGDDLGWSSEDIQTDDIPIYFTACLNNQNTPVLVVDYILRPRERTRY